MKPTGRHPENALTAVQVKNLKKPGRYADGNGLYLVVDPPDAKGRTGAKRWLLRTTVQGKRTDIGLGSVQFVALAKAREDARAMRAAAREGGDPLAERRAKKAIPTFTSAAETVHGERLAGWKNEKHGAQWLSTLEQYAFPFIGDRRVDQVTTADVHAILQPIWHEKAETARRVRQRLRTVLDWAAAHGHRSGENPASLVAKSLGKQTDKRQDRHHAAMPYADVPEFVQRLRGKIATSEVVRLALEFVILTAARTGEALGARPGEIDLDKMVWVVPAERMKAGREHRVPLPDRCGEIVRRAMELDGGGYLFSVSRRGKPLSNLAMLMHLRRADLPYTVHGFRSSFRDWASEQTGVSREVCEAALAHTIKNKAEAAYARSDLFERRRKLMEAWANYLAAPASNKVVALRTQA